MPNISFALFFSLILAITVGSLKAQDPPILPDRIFSVYAVDMTSGKVILDENSHATQIPASCMKIITTAAALHILKPDFKFKTLLEYDGEITPQGTLKGNIYIKGGGDPCLGSLRSSLSNGWDRQQALWADSIEKAQIKKIEGKILADASRWEKAMAVPSWAYEDLGNYYGAGASALSFNENSYKLVFKPANITGLKAEIIRKEPFLPNLTIDNEVTTGKEGSCDQACIFGAPYCQNQVVRGTIPFGVNEFTIKGAIPNPPASCAYLLTHELQKRAITIEEQEIQPLGKRKMLHETLSPKLSEIIYLTNQKSINLYAEHLFKMIGETTIGFGSTLNGQKGVLQFLASKNIDISCIHIEDGSGLSRKNMVTVKLLVDVLLMMKQSDYFAPFLASLPMQGKHILAKSGSMEFIKGYAGYSNGIAFAILTNQSFSKHETEKVIAELFNFFQNHPNS